MQSMSPIHSGAQQETGMVKLGLGAGCDAGRCRRQRFRQGALLPQHVVNSLARPME